MADRVPPVLTVADLERQQLAHEVAVPMGTRYEISPSGQRMLLDRMAARAAWLLAHPEEARVAAYRAIGEARRRGGAK